MTPGASTEASPADARQRVAALEALFREVAATRMAGVPVLHPRLSVAAVDFQPDADGDGIWGVLVTPWFMNLVWLPQRAADAGDGRPRRTPLRTGDKARRVLGGHAFDFIGAHEDRLGPYETCSLFSPMFEFEDQSAALATAQAVVDTLRAPAGTAPPAVAPPPAGPAVPSRRAILFGRGAGAPR